MATNPCLVVFTIPTISRNHIVGRPCFGAWHACMPLHCSARPLLLLFHFTRKLSLKVVVRPDSALLFLCCQCCEHRTLTVNKNGGKWSIKTQPAQISRHIVLNVQRRVVDCISISKAILVYCPPAFCSTATGFGPASDTNLVRTNQTDLLLTTCLHIPRVPTFPRSTGCTA